MLEQWTVNFNLNPQFPPMSIRMLHAIFAIHRHLYTPIGRPGSVFEGGNSNNKRVIKRGVEYKKLVRDLHNKNSEQNDKKQRRKKKTHSQLEFSTSFVARRFYSRAPPAHDDVWWVVFLLSSIFLSYMFAEFTECSFLWAF